jgi:hypothetical protein
MCRRLGLGLVALATLLPAGHPQAVAAQQTEAELVHRIDSLLPLAAEARRKADEAAARRERILSSAVKTAVDSVSVGPITIVTPIEQSGRAERLFREVWEESFPGVTESRALSESTFTFQSGVTLEPIRTLAPTYRIEKRVTTDAALKENIRELLTFVLSYDLGTRGTRVGAWALEGGALQKPDHLEWVYRELASTPSYVDRGCLAGDLTDCWTALGLDMSRDEIEKWYTPDERRAVVGTRRLFYSGRAMVDLRDRCLDEGVIEACDALIRQSNRTRWEPTFPAARGAMLWYALEAGGPGAWARLLEDPTMEPGDALRYASGLSTEALAKRWRDAIMEARPNVHAGFGATQLAGLFWIVLFAALAMRSTRWRLG